MPVLLMSRTGGIPRSGSFSLISKNSVYPIKDYHKRLRISSFADNTQKGCRQGTPFTYPMYAAKSMGEVSARSAWPRQALIATGSSPAAFSSSTLVYHRGFRQR